MINDYLHKTLSIYIILLLIINFTYSKYENNVYYFNLPLLCEFSIAEKNEDKLTNIRNGKVILVRVIASSIFSEF